MQIVWLLTYYISLFCSLRQPIVVISHDAYSKDSLSLCSINTDKIDQFFTKSYSKGLFNGNVLIACAGKIVYQNALGYANYKTKETLDIDDAFQLASVTKPITATAVLMLVDEGKLSLDDSLQKFFPEFPYEGITLRLLLSHRSGLPNYMYFSDIYWPDWKKPISNYDVLKLIYEFKPNVYYNPDRRYNYCNTNYFILALIIEKVSGMPYEKYLKTKIFTPLHMSHTSIYDRTQINNIDYKVIGHDKRKRKEQDTYLNGVLGDKGIYSSVTDLLKFDQALSNHMLLSDSILALAYAPAHKDLRLWDNYGLGWRLDVSDSTNRIIYHSGWWRGFKSYFIRYVDKRITLIVLSNTTRTHLSLKRLKALIEDGEK